MYLFNIEEHSKTIDYLFEDPPINGQTFALVSIVGPNLQQKCNVYGLKVRGVANSLESAKTMSLKLTKIDPDFDIEFEEFAELIVEECAGVALMSNGNNLYVCELIKQHFGVEEK